MSLERTVYHFGGKDYERNQFVTFKFNVQRVSINNFLSIPIVWGTVRNIVTHVSEYFNDFQHTHVDNKMKAIEVRCWPETLYSILVKLGMHEHDDIDKLELNIRNAELRTIQYRKVKTNEFAYCCFDPIKKVSVYRSNTPIKITQTTILNGKLWRKYKG